MRVSLVTADDIPWIVEELRELPKQSAVFADVEDDPAYVRSYLWNWMQVGLFGVCTQDTRSFLLASLVRPWYANRLEVHEQILWVPEEHRGSRTALRLIKEFTRVAKLYEPYSITVGASLDITDADKTLALYQYAGYTRTNIGATMRL